jgi:hypothetical protein
VICILKKELTILLALFLKYKSRPGAVDFHGERVTTFLCRSVQIYAKKINLQLYFCLNLIIRYFNVFALIIVCKNKLLKMHFYSYFCPVF